LRAQGDDLGGQLLRLLGKRVAGLCGLLGDFVAGLLCLLRGSVRELRSSPSP